jgi:hypothetical protein
MRFNLSAGVDLDGRKRAHTVTDRLRGQSHSYNIVTGATTPPLKLPVGIRGKGILAALNEYNNDSGDSLGHVGDLDISLHTSMYLSAQGSTDSIIFHASPKVYIKPWYDFVKLLAVDDDGCRGEDGGEGRGYAFWVGRVQTFLCVQVPADNSERLLALVQLYGVQRKNSKERRRVCRRGENDYCFDMESPEAYEGGIEGVPFAVLEPAVWKNGEPYLWLVDTEVLSKGLWGQECFDRRGKYWFMTKASFHD